jgi:hypothetical protein
MSLKKVSAFPSSLTCINGVIWIMLDTAAPQTRS